MLESEAIQATKKHFIDNICYNNYSQIYARTNPQQNPMLS